MRVKKGISSVVTTVLIILVSIIAVIIMWQVIKNLIKTDEFENPVIVDLIIDKAEIIDGLKAKVDLSMGTTEKIDGAAIVLGNSGESQTYISQESISALEARSFTIPLNISEINKISVFPIMIKNNQIEFLSLADFKTEIGARNENLYAFYKFEENANDETGSYPGILSGGIICSFPGKNGKSCGFDGSDDQINISGIPINQFTISFWIKYNPLSSVYNAVMSKETTGISGFRIAMNGNTKKISFWTTESGGNLASISTSALNSNEWYHIAVSYDGSKGKIYLNGTKKEEKTGNYIPSADKLYVGRINGYTRWNGNIDELRFYNRVLTDEEIRLLAK